MPSTSDLTGLHDPVDLQVVGIRIAAHQSRTRFVGTDFCSVNHERSHGLKGRFVFFKVLPEPGAANSAVSGDDKGTHAPLALHQTFDDQRPNRPLYGTKTERG